MWRLGTWFSGGLGSARLMVGLNDLQGLFKPKRFYDSTILYWMFLKCCLSDYFHETEVLSVVLSASSLPVALEFPSAESGTDSHCQGKKKLKKGYLWNYSRCYPYAHTLSCLLFPILALVPVERDYMQRDEFSLPYL